jgi:hypothetical protein
MVEDEVRGVATGRRGEPQIFVSGRTRPSPAGTPTDRPRAAACLGRTPDTRT